MPANLTFGEAVELLREGRRVARQGWNGQGMYLELQISDENSKMKRPYIYIVPSDDMVVPWTASQADILTDDWYPVDAA